MWPGLSSKISELLHAIFMCPHVRFLPTAALVYFLYGFHKSLIFDQCSTAQMFLNCSDRKMLIESVDRKAVEFCVAEQKWRQK